MSVVTTADEKLSSVKEHLRLALEDLSEIVIQKCWGYDEFNRQYQRILHECFTELVNVRSRLCLDLE